MKLDRAVTGEAYRSAPGTRLPADDRRRQLIEAFVDEALGIGSIAGVGIRGVLARAGCTAPVLYRLFGDRRGLLLAAVRSTHVTLQQRLERAILGSDDSPASRLRRLAEDYLKRTPGRGDAFEALVNAECRGNPSVAREVRKVYAEFEEQLVALLRAGVASGEFRSDLDAPYVAWRFIDLGLFRNQMHLMKLDRPKRLHYCERALDALFQEIEARGEQ